jgi:4,5-dihydroxyphthalate decarboxylase
VTASTATKTLRTAIGGYGFFKPLKDGTISPEGVKFDHVEVEPIRNAFRMQCRNQEFDLSEMAICTYLCARDHGMPFIGLPVFCVRSFQHGAYTYNVNSGIKGPKDLEGKTGGVRAYTQTSGTIARFVLQHEYGVELEKLNWVHADEEHVEAFHANAPRNIRYEIGANLGKMLAENQIQFGQGVGGGRGEGGEGGGREPNPDFKPLIDNARAAAADWYQRTGIYPIDHMITMKQSVLDENPWLADSLFEAFQEAKRLWQAAGPDEPDRTTLPNGVVTGDRFPFGIESNRKGIEAMIQMSNEQHITRKPLSIDELFAPSTLKS